MKLVGNIVATILILFGVIFMLGAFSTAIDNQIGTLITGIALTSIGVAAIWLVNRKLVPPRAQKVQVDIDLSGDVDLEKFQCTNCGGNLSSKHVHLVAGAPTVDCPYCGVSYQISEKPKW